MTKMEENGKKWKKSVVDVQIEGVWYDLVLIVGMIVEMFFIFIVGMIIQDIQYRLSLMIIPIYRDLFSLWGG